MIKKFLNSVKKLLKKIIYPIIYSYTGYIINNFIQRLSGYKKERQRIFNSIGYYPNLKTPQSFNEKILWKKIYDQNPLLTKVSDKYRAREYLIEILGEKEAKKILIPLLYVTDKPETIPFDSLLEECIIKPNHASGKYIFLENIEKKRYVIVEDGKITVLSDCKQTRNEIIDVCRSWLLKPYGFYQHEWVYQKLKRKIIIETLLRDSSGKIPDDYKFNMFHGECRVIDFCSNRFTDLNYMSYDQYWKSLPVKWDRPGKHIEKPKKLDEMLFIAEKLSAGFDFIRVDLYLLDRKIYFGEFTNYPMSGGILFNPASYDFEMGSFWKIIPNYWIKSNINFKT